MHTRTPEYAHMVKITEMLNRIDLGTGKHLRFGPDVEHQFRRTIYVQVPRIQIDLVPERAQSPFDHVTGKHEDRYIKSDFAYDSNVPQFVNSFHGWSFEIQSPSDGLNAEVVCSHCKGPFKPEEDIVACKDKFFHQSCFVCAQCFRPLSHTEFYEYEGRRYCKYDFQMLFAPFCSKCGEFIMARVIKAMGRSWHPQCLVCDRCGTQLGSTGLQKIRGRPYCRSCFVEVAQHQMGQQICQACRCPISPNELIRFKGDPYHPHHFQCALCDSELGPDARERDGDLYCLRCFDKMGIPICSACRRPIEGRIVWALGRTWHVEHFVCHHCELPFMGGRFYEWRGHAYCLTHYQSRIGNVCHICNKAVTGVLARFTNKAYCPIHFTCSTCDTQLNEKSKLYEIDLKPVCKDCYERFPTHWKRRLAKLHLTETPK